MVNKTRRRSTSCITPTAGENLGSARRLVTAAWESSRVARRRCGAGLPVVVAADRPQADEANRLHGQYAVVLWVD